MPLEVFGLNLKGAFLWVGTEQLRETLFADAENQIRLTITVNDETVFDYLVAIDRILEKILEDGRNLPVIDRDRTGRYSGKYLTFRYFIGSEYNGLRYIVQIDQNGIVREMTGIVTNGYIIFRAVNAPSAISVILSN